MRTATIVISIFSILDMIFTAAFGGWVSYWGRQIIGDPAKWVSFHMTQAVGTVVITMVALGLVILRKKNIPVFIMAFLAALGMVFTWLSGLLTFHQPGLIAVLARVFHFHGAQAISTVLFGIVTLSLAIAAETQKE